MGRTNMRLNASQIGEIIKNQLNDEEISLLRLRVAGLKLNDIAEIKGWSEGQVSRISEATTRKLRGQGHDV